MKATGIVRKIDKLGRIVMLIELRRTLGIYIKDPIEIFVDADTIILKKHQDTCCYICNSTKGIKQFKSKNICLECI